jgi:hypothetical protein
MPSEWISEHLPSDAQDAGIALLWHRDRETGRESATLLDKHRQALFYWPYNPSLGEVRDKAMEILKEGRLE